MFIRILVCIILLAITILLSHFSTVTHILISSYALTIISGLILLKKLDDKRKIILGSFSLLLFVLIVDLGFRLYGEGNHDKAGKGIADVCLFFNLIIAEFFIFYFNFKNKKLLNIIGLGTIYIVFPVIFYFIFNNW